MSGRTSQRKGRAGELELCHILQGAGYDVIPGEPLAYGTVPDLMGLPGVHIEVKRAEQIKLSEWMNQAERDSNRFHDGLPCVFHRKNREPWMVTMTLTDWLTLYKKGGRLK